VRTGVDPFRRKYSKESFEVYADHPELSGLFNRAMTQTARMSAKSVANFGLDFPHVVKGAPDVLVSLGVADRVTVVAGDLRDGLPAGADAYIFHRVLGGWEEPQIIETLKQVHSEIGDQPHARLIIAEPMVPPPNNFTPFACSTSSSCSSVALVFAPRLSGRSSSLWLASSS
jgi:hypothetical protein